MSTEDQLDDEIVTVTLPKRDYERLRNIIDRDRSLGYAGKWLRSVLIYATSTIAAIVLFWEQIKTVIKSVFGVQ